MVDVTVPQLQTPNIGFAFDPARSYLQAAQVKNALAQGQMNAFALKRAQDEEVNQNAFAQAVPQLTNPDTQQSALTGLASSTPGAIPQATQFLTQYSALQKSKRDQVRQDIKDKHDAIAQVINPLKDVKDPTQRQQMFQASLPDLVAQGIKPQDLQRVDLSDQGIDQFAKSSQNIAEQMAEVDKAADRKNKTDTLSETVRNNTANQKLKAAEINKPISLAPGNTLVSPATGLPVGGGQAAGGADTSNLHGDDFLKTLPPAQATEVRALAEGRLPMPTGFSMAKLQPLIQQVGQYDPEFDAVNYNARYKARSDATSQKTAQNITALRTAIAHASQLYDQIGNVAGHSGFPGATLVNRGINTLTQSAGVPGVTNYQNNTRDLSDEVTRAFRQAGGSESEIKDRLAGLSENLSSEDKKDALRGVVDRLQSRIDNLKDQYERGMGTDKYPLNFIDAKTQAHLDKINGKPAGASSSDATPQHPANIPANAQYSASRQQYRVPDGKGGFSVLDKNGNPVQ